MLKLPFDIEIFCRKYRKCYVLLTFKNSSVKLVLWSLLLTGNCRALQGSKDFGFYADRLGVVELIGSATPFLIFAQFCSKYQIDRISVFCSIFLILKESEIWVAFLEQ